MTRNEALLLQIMEEATEVAQASSKCLRFGTESTNLGAIKKQQQLAYTKNS